MPEDEPQESAHKRRHEEINHESSSPTSNIVSRTFSSIFKRRRQSTSPYAPQGSIAKLKSAPTSEEEKKEPNPSPKLTSPLPKLNLASTRLNNSSSLPSNPKTSISSTPRSTSTTTDQRIEQTRTMTTTLPLFSIGKAGNTSTNAKRAEARKLARARAISNASSTNISINPGPALSRSRSDRSRRSSRLMRKNSIETFSVSDNFKNHNGSQFKPPSNSITNQSPFLQRTDHTSRLLERRRKNALRRKVKSNMNLDTVNRILEQSKGILFPQKQISSDLGLTKLNAQNSKEKQSLKVNIIGKYQVGGPRWNQSLPPSTTNVDNDASNGFKPPAKSLGSLHQYQSLPSTATSQSRGVRFDLSTTVNSNNQRSTPESKSSTSSLTQKRMPRVQTPATKKISVQNNSISPSLPIPTQNINGHAGMTTPTNSKLYSTTHTPTATTSSTPQSSKKRKPAEMSSFSNSDDPQREFTFHSRSTPVSTKRIAELDDDDLITPTPRKRVHYTFSSNKVEGKVVKKGTPYPHKISVKSQNDSPSSSSSSFSNPTSHFHKSKANLPFSPDKVNQSSTQSSKNTSTPSNTNTATPSKQPVVNTWGANMFAKPGEWSCTTCLAKNPKEEMKCLACSVAKDGSSAKADDTKGDTSIKSPTEKSGSGRIFGSQSVASSGSISSTGGFMFGTKKTDSNASSNDKKTENTFTFGVSNSNKTHETNKEKAKVESKTDTGGGITGGFVFGKGNKDSKSKPVTPGGFTFGAVKTEETNSKPSTTSAFTFGAPKDDSKQSTGTTGGFSYGSSLESKKPSSDLTNGFKFGEDTQKATTANTQNEDKKTSSLFGTKIGEKSNGETSKATSGFSFGTATSTKIENKSDEKKTSSFQLSAPAPAPPPAVSTPAQTSNLFNLAPKDTASSLTTDTSKPASGLFGSSKTNGTGTSQAPALSFGIVKPAPPNPLIAPSTESQKTEEDSRKKKRNIDSETSITPNVSGTSAPAPPNSATLAAIPTTTNTSVTPSFQFGSASNQASTSSVKPFTFGSASASTAPTTPAKAPVPSTTPAPSFAFGSTPASKPIPSTAMASTPAPPFQFGATPSASQTTAQTPSMPFGASAPPAPASTPAPTTPAFTFGQQTQSAVASQQPHNSFAFGAATPAPVAQPVGQPSFSFGANNNIQPQPVAQFGAGGFGSQATPNKTGFGTTNPPTPGGFGTTTTASQGGFGGGFGQNPTGMMPAGVGGFSIGTGGTKSTKIGAAPVRRRIKAKRPPPSMK